MNLHNLTIREIIEGYTLHKFSSTELFAQILGLVKKLPREFRFELGSQLIRAGLSVILNIAEGSGKSTDKELNRYFDIALGSLYEVLAACDVMKDNNFITEEEFKEVFRRVGDISNQLEENRDVSEFLGIGILRQNKNGS